MVSIVIADVIIYNDGVAVYCPRLSPHRLEEVTVELDQDCTITASVVVEF